MQSISGWSGEKHKISLIRGDFIIMAFIRKEYGLRLTAYRNSRQFSAFP